MFLNLITIGAFLAVSLLAFMISEWIRSGKLRAQAISDLDTSKMTAKKAQAPGAFRRAMAGAIPQFGGEIERIEKDLKRAGYYRPWALIDYLSSRNAMVVMSLFAFMGLAVMAKPGSDLPPVLFGAGCLTALLGYGLPRLFLARQAKARVERIQTGLPDALDIVHMCLSGGLPLRESLARVSKEIEFFHPDIAVEFEVIRRQADADTMAKALRQFAERIDSPDVSALASLVTQADQLGTHVADAVTEFAVGVRRNFQQRAEERANKTSIKMLFPVVLCLAPPIYILLMGPPLIKMKNFIMEENKPGGILDPSAINQANANTDISNSL